jgi:hypothetical protein
MFPSQAIDKPLKTHLENLEFTCTHANSRISGTTTLHPTDESGNRLSRTKKILYFIRKSLNWSTYVYNSIYDVQQRWIMFHQPSSYRDFWISILNFTRIKKYYTGLPAGWQNA